MPNFGNYYEPTMPMSERDVVLADLQLKLRTVEVTGDITHEMARSVCRQIRMLEVAEPEEPITIIIDSDGGSMHAGMMIVDTVLTATVPIVTRCIGSACSAAALILAAGDKREIMPQGRTMIHAPALPKGDYSGYNLYQVHDLLRGLIAAHDQLVALTMYLTKQPQEEVEKEIKAGALRNSRQALAFGLVDEIIGIADPGAVTCTGVDDETQSTETDAGTDEGTDEETDAETNTGTHDNTN